MIRAAARYQVTPGGRTVLVKPVDGAGLAPIAANLEPLTATARERLPEAEIVMKLGCHPVAEAGIHVCEVVDKKISRGKTLLVTDGGPHHHLSASGNFGQVIRKNYPVCVGNRVEPGENGETVSVVGPLCTPLDLLADKMLLSAANVGDLMVIFQSGAYDCSASPHHFLSHPPPREILL